MQAAHALKAHPLQKRGKSGVGSNRIEGRVHSQRGHLWVASFKSPIELCERLVFIAQSDVGCRQTEQGNVALTRQCCDLRDEPKRVLPAPRSSVLKREHPEALAWIAAHSVILFQQFDPLDDPALVG